jgi:hypothetical protein
MAERRGTSLDDLLAQAEAAARRDTPDDDGEHWGPVQELQRRGDERIFSAAGAWCLASEPALRCLGADVLGQLGYDSGHPFAARSEPILASMLADSEPTVVFAVLIALGHLGLGDLDALCGLALHESEDVRLGLAVCLGTREEMPARDALIRLSGDVDVDVRDWATFGLGAQSDVDTPAIRDALLARLADEDDDVRGEAVVGLAERRDARVLRAIALELSRDDPAPLIFDAVEAFPHADLIPVLERWLAVQPEDARARHALGECRSLPDG